MSLNNKNILVTGAAGFIGAALSLKLLNKGKKIVGIDNLNSYYDIKLKMNRLKNIDIQNEYTGNWEFKKFDITNRKKLFNLFEVYKPSIVINLAAQAGVRYSIQNPQSYIKNNLLGFSNILEACSKYQVENLLYASSSSVYGLNKRLPFDEDQRVDHPVSLYAATKRSNELLAHSYSHIHGIPCTGLRFFTVYGPWGRPDMAPMIFSKAIIENKPIDIFNYGNMLRDFTYIDDVVNCIYLCCDKPATRDSKFDYSNSLPSSSFAPHRIFNIGNSKPVELTKFIEILEKEIGQKAIRNFQTMQKGDVISTFASMENIKNWVGFEPKVNLKEGIKLFVNWYRNYY